MKSFRTLLAAITLALPLIASAQWQWIDKDGRKVFSDQAPPAGVPDKNILRRPAGKAGPMPAEVPAAAAAPAPTAAPGGPNAPKLSGKDKELEDKKKQQEAAANEKRKAEEERVAKARADNCARAKASKASFDSGVRISRTNAKGEKEVIDDAGRAVEVQRLQELISSECGPRPAASSAGRAP